MRKLLPDFSVWMSVGRAVVAPLADGRSVEVAAGRAPGRVQCIAWRYRGGRDLWRVVAGPYSSAMDARHDLATVVASLVHQHDE